ncbi:MAG: translation initiation factor IF-2 [Actinomycetota bacterium]
MRGEARPRVVPPKEKREATGAKGKAEAPPRRHPVRERERQIRERATPPPVTKPMRKALRVPSGITVREFAQRVGKRPGEIMRILAGLGERAEADTPIPDDYLQLLAMELGVEVEIKTRMSEEILVEEDAPDTLRPRPPVVTVMGHVDHGKTSLLDAIRKTNVTEREMGGITQHIGASVVEYQGQKITFIDTPGHESFTALRARGAKVTDIAVLVVAADDGVMPQTIEAIDHARAAGVPIMVAVNKIDKPEANPTRVRQQLTEFNLVPEEWGGDTVFVDVSAKEGTNLDHLLEMILLLGEINDLKANPDAAARGYIIEARLDKGRGPVATVLVKRGTLKRGDALVAGKAYGRARALIDDHGRNVDQAGPSMPVEVLGLNTVPEAGDEFAVVEDEKKARALVDARLARERAEVDRKPSRTLTLEDLFRQIQEGESLEFNLIIKGDTQGSVEAVRDSVLKLKVGDIEVKVIHAGVGAINENDVMLAKASGAVILGFNVRPDSKTQEMAERERVEIRTYRVIYQLLEDMEAALRGMLKPEYEEVRTGLLEVRATFRIPRQGVVAGALVKEGEITRNSRVRLVRDGVIIYEGGVASLRRFKDDVRSVSAGYECGVGLENFQDIKEGDLIEVIEVRERPLEGGTSAS